MIMTTNERIISEKLIKGFEARLREDEKSGATVSKYLHDVRCFAEFARTQTVSKSLTLAYKAELGENYTAVSANSMIAALNTFLRFAGWDDAVIKQFRVQKKMYCAEEKELTKEEYIRLVKTARRAGRERLDLILQTICGTGIRVSELKFITAEAVRRGEAVVSCKNKTRTVFIVRELRSRLLNYMRRNNIESGSVFVSASGKPVDRTTVWREMKSLCAAAGVSADKVFPHNLRHLFARIFYSMEKDIAKLADILGHTSINTTRIYIISTGAEHRRRMENMRLII